MSNKEVELFALLRQTDSDYVQEVCQTLLRKAALKGDAHIAKALLDSWSEYIGDANVTSAYILAFHKFQIKTMDVLGPRIEHLRHQFRLRFDELVTNEGLCIKVDFARYCIENKYYPIDPGSNSVPINAAAICGNVELVKLFMSYPSVDPSAEKSRALKNCLQRILKIADQAERARYIETVRALVSDVRVNSSMLRVHTKSDDKKFIPEVADMVQNALRRCELRLDMKIKALPSTIPKFLRFLIVAQSVVADAIQNENDNDLTLDLTILRRRLHVPLENLMSRRTAIHNISKSIESFLQ